MNKWLCLIPALAISIYGQSQTNFRTNGTGGGDWNVNATWEVETPNGSNIWIPASSTPTSASNTISILANDVVTVTSAVTIDQTNIALNGSLVVNDPVVLTLNNGTGADLRVFGELHMLGESLLNGAGNVQVNSDIFVGSLHGAGAIQVAAALAGNIQGPRTFNSGASVTYDGTGPQFIGGGNPATNGVNTVIDNSSGVSLNSTGATVTIGGDLTITSGTLNVQNNGLRVNGSAFVQAGSIALATGATARIVTVVNDLHLVGGGFSATSGATVATLTVTGILDLQGEDLTLSSGAANVVVNVTGDIAGTNFIQSSGANSNVVINGTGALTNAGPFGSGSTFEQITLNRAGTVLDFASAFSLASLRITAGDAITSADFLLTADLNLATGTTFDFSDDDFELRGRFNNSLTGGLLLSNASSNLNLTGSSSVGTLTFGAANTLNSLTLNRPTGGTLVTINSPLTINTALNLTDGGIMHTSGLSLPGATFTINSAASLGGTAPGGTYDVVYTGASMSTGIETSGTIDNITSNSAGTVTVSTPTLTANSLTVNSGTFSAGASVATLGTIVNSATLTGSSTTLTVSGNFTNNGTYNHNNGTVAFAGTTSIVGTSPTFRNIMISGTLNAPATLNLTGNFVNDGTFNQGAGTVQFTAGNSQAISGSQSTAFNNMTINKTGVTVLTISSAVSVSSTLSLTVGTLDNSAGLLAMGNSSTFVRNSSTVYTGLAPTGGPYNVQYTGTGLITTGQEAGGTLNNITSNSTSIVSVGPATLTAVSLTINSGTFTFLSSVVSFGTVTNSATLTASTATFTITGNFTNNATFNHNTGTVVFGGTSSILGTAPTFQNITITGTLNAPASLTLVGNFVDNGTFNAGAGTVSFTSSNAQSVSGSQVPTFNILTINKTAATTLTIGSSTSVSNTLNLTVGRIDNSGGFLSMVGGSTFVRASGTTYTGLAPTGGPYDLQYTGSTLTTSQEADGLLDDVTSNSTGTVTLGTSGVTASSLTVNSGTFSFGANTATFGDILNAGTINASSTTLTITGDLTNNGTFNHNNGTVEFGGVSSILGSVPTFHSISITGTLNAPASLSLRGNFSNTGTFNNNSGTVQFIVTNAQAITGGPSTFFVLTINKSAGTTVTVSGSTLVSNTLNLTVGRIDNTAGFLSMSPTAVINRGSTTTFLGAAPGGGPYDLNYSGTSLSAGPEAQGNLRDLTNNVSGTATVSVAVSLGRNLSLNSGVLANPTGLLTLSGVSTLTRNSAASMTGVAPAGGPYDLIYTGTSLTSGVEISGSLDDVTTNCSGTVTLATAFTAAGDLIINSGTLTAGANAITVDAFVNSGIFNAPTPAALTLSGDLTNNGTFNRGAGRLVVQGMTQILGSSNPTLHNITIAGAGTLISPASLLVTGSFTSNGSFVAGTGTLVLNGVAVQDITGLIPATFNNITTNNTSGAGVRVESNQNLGGVLTLAAGTQFDADGSVNTSVFTLLSLDDEPTQDASIAAIPGTSSVNGSITVQRNMRAKGEFNRYITSPVSNAIRSDLADDFDVTGLKYYDETLLGDIEEGYLPTDNEDILVPGRGYLAFMWDGDLNVLWDLRGPISLNQNRGPVDLNVSHTPSAPPDPNADGWNLVGNPYPSGIVWDNGAGWTKNDIAPIIYVPDIANGVYRTWNANTASGDLPNGIVTTGQAFWVYANLPGASLVVNEAAKTSAAGTFFRERAEELTNGLVLSLTHEGVTDNSYIMINRNATDGYDPLFDGFKLDGEKFSIASVDKANRRLVSNVISEIDRNLVIPVYVKGEEGMYEMSFSQQNNFEPFGDLWLIDAFLDKQVKVAEIGRYEFEITGSAKSRERRFFLSKNPESITAESREKMVLTVYPNPVSEKLTVEISAEQVHSISLIDDLGRLVEQIPVNKVKGTYSGTAEMKERSNGLYFVKAVVDGKVVIEKLIKN